MLLTTPPAAPTNLAISPDNGISSSDGLTDTGSVTLTGTLAESGLTVVVSEANTELGTATVNGTSFSIPLNLQAGSEALQVTAEDAAGNVSPVGLFTAFIDLTPPSVSSFTGPSPTIRNSSVSTIDVTFSEAINPATFTTADLSLTDNGGPNLITSAVTINFASGFTYQIGGLSGLTSAEGNYKLTVDATGIHDLAGNAGTNSLSTTWSMDTTPPTSTVSPLPPTTTSTSFTVSVTGSDPSGSNGSTPSGIKSFAVYDQTNGGAWTYWQTLSPSSGTPNTASATFTGSVGHTYGFYSIATDNAGNVQPTPAAAQTTVQILSPLSIISIAAVSPNSRATAVSSINITFSEPINTGSLSPGALTLTDDGGANLINSGVSLTLVSGDTYAIGGLGGLTTAQGKYTLTVNAADIQDQGGAAGTSTSSISWLMDTTAPTSHVINSLGASQTSDTFPVSVTFSDPAGSGGAPASGVSSVDLYVSVNNGPFTLFQTQSFAPTASGTVTFTFAGQDRNLYAFHSVAQDAAGNTESKSSTAIEASTSVPDLNPPVTHILASSPSYSWGPFPSSEFSGLTPSSYSNGVFTLNWAGADPDQSSGVPAGSIALVNIYVQIDHSTTPTLIGQLSGGTPNSSGVYSGSMTYDALGDGLTHTYSFFSVGVDDQQKEQYAPQAGPAAPDVTFSNITYSAPLAVQSLTVEKSIAERSYIRYLDVSFNQSLSTTPPSSALQALASGLTGKSASSYVELLWYGENLTASSTPKGSVNLFNVGTTAKLSLNGNDLSIDFGANGITGLLTETKVKGTGSPTTSFGDGWYALGIDPTGNPSNRQVFWLPFFRLLGDTNGDGVVTGPYTTAGTDAYTVYHAEGQSGALLDADVNGDGYVNSKDLSETAEADGHSVGATPPATFPQFQLFAGAAASGNAVAVTQAQVQALVPQAIAAWQAAGLDAADVRRLEGVPVQVGDLGTSILGVEAAGAITINQTAAGHNWYAGATTAGRAFGLTGPGGEAVAGSGSPAADDVDLLTVLEHELGHVIGLSDNTQSGDLMDITLGLGVRRAPTAGDLAAIDRDENTAALATAAHVSHNAMQVALPGGPAAPMNGPARESSGAAPGAAGRTVAVLTGDEPRRRRVAAQRVSSPDATVDAAPLASILGTVEGDGDGQDPVGTRDSMAGSAGRPSVIGATPGKQDRSRRFPAPYRRRLLSSLFLSKARRPDPAPAAGPEPSEWTRGE